ncbi:MAG: SRPBCC family protein [Chloroflexi bacterium]|nr:SRPBCC family protein [Chloroflexota bacterium]
MKVKATVSIKGKKEDVWNAITDIEGSVERVGAIESIEILEKPETGILGLKWKETRTMFGQEATEVMWITDAKENEYYQTRAENHGAVYVSRLEVEEVGNETTLTMGFEGEPQGLGAKIMSFLTGFMFKGATEKALKQDLIDIKAFVEKSAK